MRTLARGQITAAPVFRISIHFDQWNWQFSTKILMKGPGHVLCSIPGSICVWASMSEVVTEGDLYWFIPTVCRTVFLNPFGFQSGFVSLTLLSSTLHRASGWIPRVAGYSLVEKMMLMLNRRQKMPFSALSMPARKLSFTLQVFY